jgi:hypothetical protein
MSEVKMFTVSHLLWNLKNKIMDLIKCFIVIIH